VTLGDATVERDGTWRVDDVSRIRPDRAGRVTVLLPPSSADLVTLTPAEATPPTNTRAHTAQP
jgi:hypothetical protein